MLGPLPTFYRVVVAVCTFLAFLALGLWAAYALPHTVLAAIGTRLGTGLGVGLGLVAALLVLRGPDHADHGRHRVRARSPRH